MHATTTRHPQIPYYYLLMVAGYSVGLMMANVAVYVMDMGQVRRPTRGRPAVLPPPPRPPGVVRGARTSHARRAATGPV